MKKKKNESGANRAVQADKKEKKKEIRGEGKERRKEQREGERKRKKGFSASLYDLQCEAPNPGVSLTTRQLAEFIWISGNPIPHCCVPFNGIHILKKIG